MALYSSGAGGKYWRVTGLGLKPKTMGPYSIMVWSSPATTTDQIYAAMCGVPATSTSGSFALIFSLSGSWRIRQDDGAASSISTTANATTVAGAWTMTLGSYDATGNGLLYVHRGGGGDVITNNTLGLMGAVDPTWDDFSIHGYLSSAFSTVNSQVAEVAMWNRVVSYGEVRMLARGVNPLSLPGTPPLFYWPLRGDLAGYGQSRIGLTGVGNPTVKWGAHPPVALMPRRTVLPAAAAVPPPAVRPRISMVF